MDKDQQQDRYSKKKEAFLSFVKRLEQSGKTLPIEDLNGPDQTIEINKYNNEGFKRSLKAIEKEERSQILPHQDNKNKQDNSHDDMSQPRIHSQTNHQRKIQSVGKGNQYDRDSQQIVRKSKRLRDKEKRKHTTSQPRRNYTSMIKKLEKQHKQQQAKQMIRPLIERLKNPGKSTLRETNIMFKNNQFYYSISVKIQQYCTEHKPDKKCPQNNPSIKQQLSIQHNATCNKCKRVGTYWFSSQQLQRYNNGNFIRKYLETFI